MYSDYLEALPLIGELLRARTFTSVVNSTVVSPSIEVKVPMLTFIMHSLSIYSYPFDELEADGLFRNSKGDASYQSRG